MTFETFERHGTEKPRRHDAIGVNVITAQRKASSGNVGDCWHV
jgi:hypothetical protein